MKVLLISLLTFLSHATEINFHQHIVLGSGQEISGTHLGGLSGLRYDNKEKRIYVISDDRSNKSPARLYTFDVINKNNKIEIKNPIPIILKNKNGKPFLENTIDFEDIDFTPSGNLIITSEGDLRGREIKPPRIIEFKRNGEYIRDIHVDDKFIPVNKNGYFVAGVKSNYALESLSFTPSENFFFTAPEEALEQDKGEVSTEKTTPLRFMKYSIKKNHYIPMHEYVYPYGPIVKLGAMSKDFLVFSGVPGFLALDDNTLLTLERTFYPAYRRTKVILYKTKFDASTTNVIEEKSLVNKKYKQMMKELILDFDDFLPYFQEGARHVDNLEGICLGPKLANGKQTIFFVSDDNFSSKQKTYFIIGTITL
jgi:hypothetical protein